VAVPAVPVPGLNAPIRGSIPHPLGAKAPIDPDVARTYIAANPMISGTTSIAATALAARGLLYTPVMNKLLVLALSLPMVACVVGSDPGTPADDQPVDPGPGPGPGSGSGTVGHITQDTSWTGAVSIDVGTTIDPGVTVTAAPGTTVTIASGAGLTIQGILDLQGTSAAKVTIQSPTAADTHAGLNIPAGGELRMSYGVQTGGGIHLSGTGKATIVDSTLNNPGAKNSRGDYLTMSGGSLDISYSNIGLPTGDGTHCNFHFGSAGNTIKVDHVGIIGNDVGLMLYGGTGAILTNSNWTSLSNIETQPGVTADITGSFFQGGTPVAGGGASFSGTPTTTERVDVGPRP